MDNKDNKSEDIKPNIPTNINPIFDDIEEIIEQNIKDLENKVLCLTRKK